MTLETGFSSVNNEDEAILVVREEPTIIASLPEFLLTDNVLFEALSREIDCYDLIDRNSMSDDLILRLMLHNSYSIEYLPKRKIKPDFYIKMVSENGLSIRHIPSFALNSKICNAAVKSDPRAHEYVPVHLQDQEYLNNLIKRNPTYVGKIDITQRDTKVLVELVDTHPEIIRFMVMEDRTKEICIRAMEKNYTLIHYFPENIYEDEEILKLMSKLEFIQNPTSRLPADLVRKPLANYLFKERPEIYRFLPASTITTEMARKAIEQDPSNIYATPPFLRADGKLWEVALKQNESFWEMVPQNEQSDQVRIFIARKKSQRNHSAKNQENANETQELN